MVSYSRTYSTISISNTIEKHKSLAYNIVIIFFPDSSNSVQVITLQNLYIDISEKQILQKNFRSLTLSTGETCVSIRKCLKSGMDVQYQKSAKSNISRVIVAITNIFRQEYEVTRLRNLTCSYCDTISVRNRCKTRKFFTLEKTKLLLKCTHVVITRRSIVNICVCW